MRSLTKVPLNFKVNKIHDPTYTNKIKTPCLRKALKHNY